MEVHRIVAGMGRNYSIVSSRVVSEVQNNLLDIRPIMVRGKLQWKKK